MPVSDFIFRITGRDESTTILDRFRQNLGKIATAVSGAISAFSALSRSADATGNVVRGVARILLNRFAVAAFLVNKLLRDSRQLVQELGSEYSKLSSTLETTTEASAGLSFIARRTGIEIADLKAIIDSSGESVGDLAKRFNIDTDDMRTYSRRIKEVTEIFDEMERRINTIELNKERINLQFSEAFEPALGLFNRVKQGLSELVADFSEIEFVTFDGSGKGLIANFGEVEIAAEDMADKFGVAEEVARNLGYELHNETVILTSLAQAARKAAEDMDDLTKRADEYRDALDRFNDLATGGTTLTGVDFDFFTAAGGSPYTPGGPNYGAALASYWRRQAQTAWRYYSSQGGTMSFDEWVQAGMPPNDPTTSRIPTSPFFIAEALFNAGVTGADFEDPSQMLQTIIVAAMQQQGIDPRSDQANVLLAQILETLNRFVEQGGVFISG